MRATKETVLDYLKEFKLDLHSKGVESIGLFGSFAHNQQTPYSDIDIAIKKSSNFIKSYGSYGYFSLVEYIKEELGSTFHRTIDIFDLDSRSEFTKCIEKELINV